MDLTDTAAAQVGASGKTRDRAYITAACMLVMVLASMEATVTSTAMPTIIGDLHGLEHYSWVASIYLLTSTIVMPLYGRLSDVLGRKRVILFAIGLFAAGSIAAAFSKNMVQLIAFRGVQGLGAGGIMPVVLTIIGDIFTLEERAKMQGYFSVVWGTAALAGPALGWVLVQTLGWQSVFWVNLPAGLVGLVMLMMKYHSHEKPHSTNLDLAGITTLGIGSTALLAAVSVFTLREISPWVAPLLAAVAVVMLVGFVMIERRAVNPVMPPALMMSRAIGPAVICSGILGWAVFAIETYVPLYVQGGLGGTVGMAAMTVTPVMLAWASSSFVAAPLVIRYGFRRMGLAGSIITFVGLIGLLVCAALQLHLSLLTATLFVCGCGFGPASMAYLLGAQQAVTWQQRGIVTSAVTFFRTLGGALGVGLLGAVFNWKVAPGLMPLRGVEVNGEKITPGSLLDPHKLHEIPPELLKPAQGAIVHSLLWVFGLMLAVGVIQLVITRWLPAKKAESVNIGEAMEVME